MPAAPGKKDGLIRLSELSEHLMNFRAGWSRSWQTGPLRPGVHEPPNKTGTRNFAPSNYT